MDDRKDSGLALAEGDAVEAFIERWRDTGGKERANYQLFLTELCRLLDLPGPEPAGSDDSDDAYVFERRVDINHPDGTVSRGYIDLYKRGHFVLEAKRVGEKHESSRWDKAMLRAAAQADNYIRALPADEGRPPFLLTCDVGKTIEVYSEFSRTGATYVPFPDARSHRIHLEDLRDEKIRKRLVGIWTNPDGLDPAKYAARVTRELSKTLAQLARALEKDGYHVERVAHFIKRCLFTMFCEDVDLLPRGEFTALLGKLRDTPEHFTKAIASLWQTMNDGGYSAALNQDILRFNGNLFRDIDPIPLKSEQIDLLIQAGRHDWSQVEPAIFGTLLERALDPEERHKLGAHYTPRAYVERLVMPTIIDPLRDEWKDVQAVAAALENQGKEDKAVEEIRDFHRKLCEIRILDPACGSGNFLYVTLEHMKRLEGEVLGTLTDLGAGQNLLEMQGNTVDPHQFLGLEINPRAAAIAEIVLWIGYLQWHFRTHGHINPPQPVIKAFDNIECRDAVLTYDRLEFVTGEDGRPKTVWDGKTYKKSATTGEDVPDESARVPIESYVNPKMAEWPAADYVIGNPPFIGNKRMRVSLGDGYVDALRAAWKDSVPNSADFVLYWWHHAAELLKKGELKRFGLITTNSIQQKFNRTVVEKHLYSGSDISLIFAIPDHPWVDSSDGASVRIAMTVAARQKSSGTLGTIRQEIRDENSDSKSIDFSWTHGAIHSNLSIGADFSRLTRLLSNDALATRGVIPHGSGFQLNEEDLSKLGFSRPPTDDPVIRPYMNGRDVAQRPRGVFVIDAFPRSADQLRKERPEIYQWLIHYVKPERDQQKDRSLRENWWLHRRTNADLRKALVGIDRYIVTPQTCKHRFFMFLGANVLPDDKLIAIGLEDPEYLAILSSRIHALWSWATGGRLGVGNDSVYNKSSCFDSFPFPGMESAQRSRLAEIANEIDKHRKSAQERSSAVTMTGCYNVLEKLRLDDPLTSKDQEILETALVSVLRELHDELDRAVLKAYGWDDLAGRLVGAPGATTPWPEKPEKQQEAEDDLLQRLVDLNQARAAEEAQGNVRWLRPELQAPEASPEQKELETGEVPETAAAAVAAVATVKETWPKTLSDQVRAVRRHLETGPMDAEALAVRFKRKPKKSVSAVLDALTDLGMVRVDRDSDRPVYRA